MSKQPKKTRNGRKKARRAATMAASKTMPTIVKREKKVIKDAERMEKSVGRREYKGGPPVSEAKPVEVQANPKITRVNDNEMVISHSESPGVVTVDSTKKGFQLTKFPIDISNSILFPRGSIESQNFMNQQFISFACEFITGLGTQDTGNLIMAFTPDVYAEDPTSVEDMLALERKLMIPVWQEAGKINNLVVNLNKLTKSLLIQSPSNPATEDNLPLFQAGWLYVATQDPQNAAGETLNSVGTLIVHYKVKVSTPNLPDQNETPGSALAFQNAFSTLGHEDNPLGQPGNLVTSGYWYDVHTVGVDTSDGTVHYDDKTFGIFGYIFKSSKTYNAMFTVNNLGGSFSTTTGDNPIVWYNGNRLATPHYVLNNAPGSPNDQLITQTVVQITNSFNQGSGIQPGNSLGIPSRFYGYNMLGSQVIAAGANTDTVWTVNPWPYQWHDNLVFNNSSVPQFKLDPLALTLIGRNKQAMLDYVNLQKRLASKSRTPFKPVSSFVKGPPTFACKMKGDRGAQYDAIGIDTLPDGTIKLKKLATVDEDYLKKNGLYRTSMAPNDDKPELKRKSGNQSEWQECIGAKYQCPPWIGDMNTFIPINFGGNQENNFTNHGEQQTVRHIVQCKDCQEQLDNIHTLLRKKPEKKPQEKDTMSMINDVIGLAKTIGSLFI